jgi:hypothetical protein
MGRGEAGRGLWLVGAWINLLFQIVSALDASRADLGEVWSKLEPAASAGDNR